MRLHLHMERKRNVLGGPQMPQIDPVEPERNAITSQESLGFPRTPWIPKNSLSHGILGIRRIPGIQMDSQESHGLMGTPMWF